MRLGLSSFLYRYAASPTRADAPPMDALTVLRRAHALDLDAVQFSDNMPLHTLDSRALAALKDLAADLGLGIEVGTRGIETDLIVRYVELARFFGSRALRLVLDTPCPQLAREVLKSLLPHLHEAGLPLAIENYGSMPSATLARIVNDLADPLLGFCVDVGNDLLLLERPLETAANLAPRALQLHLKDYAVERAPVGYRITGRVLGEGALELGAMLDLVRPVQRGLDIFLEAWMEPAPTWGETLLEEERWIARCVDQARLWLATNG